MAVTQVALTLSSWGLQSSVKDKPVPRQMSQSGCGWNGKPRVWGNTVRYLTSQSMVRQGFLVERTSNMRHGRRNLAKKVEKKHSGYQKEQV